MADFFDAAFLPGASFVMSAPLTGFRERLALPFLSFPSSMAPDGYFMLGAGETVIGQTKKLVADPKARGLYRLDNRDKAERRSGDERRNVARG